MCTSYKYFHHKENFTSDRKIWETFRYKVEYFRGISVSLCSEMGKKVTVNQNARSQLRLNTVAVTIVTATYLATSKPPAGASGLQSNLIWAPKDDCNITWHTVASKTVKETANFYWHVFHITAFEKLKMTKVYKTTVFVKVEPVILLLQRCCNLFKAKLHYLEETSSVTKGYLYH